MNSLQPHRSCFYTQQLCSQQELIYGSIFLDIIQEFCLPDEGRMSPEPAHASVPEATVWQPCARYIRCCPHLCQDVHTLIYNDVFQQRESFSLHRQCEKPTAPLLPPKPCRLYDQVTQTKDTASSKQSSGARKSSWAHIPTAFCCTEPGCSRQHYPEVLQ